MGTEAGPFFIVGAGRSGTTLMRLILNAHPRLAIPLETKLFVKVYEPFRRDGDWERAVDRFLDICAQRLQPAIDLADDRRALLALPAPDFATLIGLPLGHWAASEGKARWGEKTPEHLFYGEPIVNMFPGARFVELVRDPRAVVASMNRYAFKGDDPTRNAMFWNHAAGPAHAALRRHAASGHVLTVRYEDLVTAPERVVREVCAFLGEDFDPGMLAFHERSRSYLTADRAATDGKLGQAISAADLDAWRTALSARQVAIVERICDERMRAFGYRPTGRRVTLSQRGEIAVKAAYVAYKRHRQRDRYFHNVTAPIGRPLHRRREHPAGKLASTGR